MGKLSGNLSLNPSLGNCSHWDLAEPQTLSKLILPQLQNEKHDPSQNCGENKHSIRSKSEHVCGVLWYSVSSEESGPGGKCRFERNEASSNSLNPTPTCIWEKQPLDQQTWTRGQCLGDVFILLGKLAWLSQLILRYGGPFVVSLVFSFFFPLRVECLGGENLNLSTQISVQH